MRTNIDIDDALMAAAQEATGLPTKRAVVEEGLRTLVRLREQQGIRALRGRIGFVEEPPESGEQGARDAAEVVREAPREGGERAAYRIGSRRPGGAIAPDRPAAGAAAVKRTAQGRYLKIKPRPKGGPEGVAKGGEGDRRRR